MFAGLVHAYSEASKAEQSCFCESITNNAVTSQETVCALIHYIEHGDDSDPNLPCQMPTNNIEIRVFSSILLNENIAILFRPSIPFMRNWIGIVPIRYSLVIFLTSHQVFVLNSVHTRDTWEGRTLAHRLFQFTLDDVWWIVASFTIPPDEQLRIQRMINKKFREYGLGLRPAPHQWIWCDGVPIMTNTLLPRPDKRQSQSTHFNYWDQPEMCSLKPRNSITFLI
jgi:hypothetical protein